MCNIKQLCMHPHDNSSDSDTTFINLNPQCPNAFDEIAEACFIDFKLVDVFMVTKQGAPDRACQRDSISLPIRHFIH